MICEYFCEYCGVALCPIGRCAEPGCNGDPCLESAHTAERCRDILKRNLDEARRELEIDAIQIAQLQTLANKAAP